MRVTRTIPCESLLRELLAESAQRHQHLCPRQVLGVRLGLYSLRLLGLGTLRERYFNDRKRVLTIVETDGCGADGIAVATDCAIGRRTLRVRDYGKVAATVVDCDRGNALRVHPSSQSRLLAREYAPAAPSRWHAYLEAYQQIPDEELLVAKPVRLTQSIASIISTPDARAICHVCREEIINERELHRNGRLVCRHCAGDRYYDPL